MLVISVWLCFMNLVFFLLMLFRDQQLYSFITHAMQINFEYDLKYYIYLNSFKAIKQRERTQITLHLSFVASSPSVILQRMSLRQTVSAEEALVWITSWRRKYHTKWQTNGAWKHALPNSNYCFLPQPLQRNST